MCGASACNPTFQFSSIFAIASAFVVWPDADELSGNVGWVTACWNTPDACPDGVACHAWNAWSASRPRVTTASTDCPTINLSSHWLR